MTQRVMILLLAIFASTAHADYLSNISTQPYGFPGLVDSCLYDVIQSGQEITIHVRSVGDSLCALDGLHTEFKCKSDENFCEWISGDYISLTEFSVCDNGNLIDISRQVLPVYVNGSGTYDCPGLDPPSMNSKFRFPYRNISDPARGDITLAIHPSRKDVRYFEFGYGLFSLSKAYEYKVESETLLSRNSLGSCVQAIDGEGNPAQSYHYVNDTLMISGDSLDVSSYLCQHTARQQDGCGDYNQFIETNRSLFSCQFTRTMQYQMKR